jgi:hypothetical protein
VSNQEQSKEEAKVEALVKEIRDLQNNAAQLSEVEEVLHNKIFKLVEQLKALQTLTSVTVPIPPELLGQSLGDVKESSIGANAVVIGIDEEGKAFSKPLMDFPPDVVFNIVSEWAPKLKESINTKKQLIEARLNVVEKLLREFDSGQVRSVAASKKQGNDLIRSQMAY